MAKNGVSSKPQTQRQLKVGEELRHALSEVFLQGTIYEPEIAGVSVTVPEVRVSPDLKNATVFVFPLAGDAPEGFIEALNRIAPQIGHLVSRRVKLRFTPRLTFRKDNSFEVAHKLEEIFESVREDEPTGSDE